MSRFGLVLLLAALAIACSRPVPVRPEPTATPEKATSACPPCECEACPACAACPDCPTPAPEPPAAEPLPIPEHLRATPEQCKGACDRLMELEVRRAVNRVQGTQPALLSALKKGLDDEKSLLSESCVKRCLTDFTQATALCVRKFEDADRVRQCVVETSFPAR